MSVLEAIILGIVQGLTEFLPVSSSGHIELGKYLLGQGGEESLTFSIVVHAATVLSTIVVFRKDILSILKDIFKFEWNESTKFVFHILVSMIPVTIIGLFFKNEIKAFFDGNIVFVGIGLLITGALLWISYKKGFKKQEVNPVKAFFIGVAQAIAVLPGISRSGATIATGLMLGIDKDKIARFSFLMVVVPILGITILDLKDLFEGEVIMQTSNMALCFGFIAAFLTGLMACQIMIRIVKQGKIQNFSYYCWIIGTIAIIAGLVH